MTPSLGPPLAYRIPVLRRVARRLRPRALVLTYHRVADTVPNPFAQTVPPAVLALQLERVRARFGVEPLADVVAALDGSAVVDSTVAVTFDDGYADTLTAAYPIAARLGVPITVFITAAPVLTGERFWWDDLAESVLGAPREERSLSIELAGRKHVFRCDTADERRAAYAALHALLRPLGAETRREVLAGMTQDPAETSGDERHGRPLREDEVRQLDQAAGVTLGSHTFTHPVLSALSPAEQAAELDAGKRALENVVGHPVTLLAYPFGKPGDISRETLAAARRTGFAAAFTSVARAIVPPAERFALPRMTVHDESADALERGIRRHLG